MVNYNVRKIMIFICNIKYRVLLFFFFREDDVLNDFEVLKGGELDEKGNIIREIKVLVMIVLNNILFFIYLIIIRVGVSIEYI